MELIVKAVASRKGYTGVRLAKEVGMTQQNMSNIMNNKLNPSLDTLEKIAIVLDVPVYELFADYKKSTSILCPKCGNEISVEIKDR